jgi:predicted RNase H-like HicB family nuclease
MNYKAIIKQDADWWIGWVEDVPGVNAQERTREELLISLREALTDILESNREATRLAVAGEFEEVLIPASRSDCHPLQLTADERGELWESVRQNRVL